MIYSGADLIRTSGHQQLRAEQLAGPNKVSEPAKSNLSDEESQGALLRFARFLNKERKPKDKPKPVKGKGPYQEAFAKLQHEQDSGLMIDVYV